MWRNANKVNGGNKMNNVTAPKFINSPYFYIDEDGFHLKNGAPIEITKEFEQFMKESKEAEEKGVAI